MSQDTRPSGEPSPGDMDHFNSEVYSELLGMKELQSRLGMCLENQERLHQRVDLMYADLAKAVEQINAHKSTWEVLATWVDQMQRHKTYADEQFLGLGEFRQDLELFVAKTNKRLLERLEDLRSRVDDLENLAEKADNSRVNLWRAVGDLQEAENDREIERRANNAEV